MTLTFVPPSSQINVYKISVSLFSSFSLFCVLLSFDDKLSDKDLLIELFSDKDALSLISFWDKEKDSDSS